MDVLLHNETQTLTPSCSSILTQTTWTTTDDRTAVAYVPHIAHFFDELHPHCPHH